MNQIFNSGHKNTNSLFSLNVITRGWMYRLIIGFGILIPKLAFPTTSDTTIVRLLSGSATFTTKGLSTFPNLTLGKPAAIFDFSVGSENFRFEPTLRFGLDGKPWTFIFWFRYNLLKTEKFQFRFGAHPAYTFKTISVIENGKTSEIHRVHQYWAGEIAPVFTISKNLRAGPYYLYSRGISEGTVLNSNFISFRINYSSVALTDQLFMQVMAQAYYLKMDANDGFYLNSTLSLNRRNFPLSVSSTINKSIESTIPGKDFLWNINLTYAFGGRFRKL